MQYPPRFYTYLHGPKQTTNFSPDNPVTILVVKEEERL